MGWQRNVKQLNISTFALLMVFIFCFANTSMSEPMSGNEVLALPKASQDAYISGFLDGLNLFRNFLKNNPIPPNVTYGQAVDIVRKYIYLHPEVRHKYMTAIIVDSMNEYFPFEDKIPPRRQHAK